MTIYLVKGKMGMNEDDYAPSQTLVAMRNVLMGVANPNRPEEVFWRERQREKPEAFADRLTDLEKRHDDKLAGLARAKAVKASSEGRGTDGGQEERPVEKDVGEEKARKILDEILARHEEGT